MMKECKLCGEERALNESHVLPAFVYNWLKQGSGTGYLRFGDAPNKRSQDGYKKHWLCSKCEQLLAGWESEFARRIFHPLNDDPSCRIGYGDWLLKFCISVSLRALWLTIEDRGLDHFSDSQRGAAEDALRVWSNVLLGELPHPGKYEQHLLPLDVISEYSGGSLPANMNRYILLTVGVDAVRNSNTAFVFSKLGRFVLLGFIDVASPKKWVGTRVKVKNGSIEPSTYQVPDLFGSYLQDQALEFANVHERISETQRMKIERHMADNIDRLVRSKSFAAMRHDVELFGKDAIEIHKAKDNR